MLILIDQKMYNRYYRSEKPRHMEILNAITKTKKVSGRTFYEIDISKIKNDRARRIALDLNKNHIYKLRKREYEAKRRW